MNNFTWKFCRGFLEYNDNKGVGLTFTKNKQLQERNFLVDNHLDIVYYNEKDIEQDGLIEKIENADYDRESIKYLKFYQNNQEEFRKYMIKRIYDTDDDNVEIDEETMKRFIDPFYINQFIVDNNLRNEFNNFVEINNYLFNSNKSKNQIRTEILNQVFGTILSESRIKYLYLYRDRDHKSILITNLNINQKTTQNI